MLPSFLIGKRVAKYVLVEAMVTGAATINREGFVCGVNYLVRVNDKLTNNKLTNSINKQILTHSNKQQVRIKLSYDLLPLFLWDCINQTTSHKLTTVTICGMDSCDKYVS